MVLGPVQAEMAEKFAVFTEHSDVEVADEDDDAAPSPVGSTHADVVEPGFVSEDEPGPSGTAPRCSSGRRCRPGPASSVSNPQRPLRNWAVKMRHCRSTSSRGIRIRPSDEQVRHVLPPLPTSRRGRDDAGGEPTGHRDLDLLAALDPAYDLRRVLTKQLTKSDGCHDPVITQVLHRSVKSRAASTPLSI